MQSGSTAPRVIVLETFKGQGIKMLEDKDGWHGRALNAQELEQALAELGTVEYTVTKIIKASDDQTWYKMGD